MIIVMELRPSLQKYGKSTRIIRERQVRNRGILRNRSGRYRWKYLVNASGVILMNAYRSFANVVYQQRRGCRTLKRAEEAEV